MRFLVVTLAIVAALPCLAMPGNAGTAALPEMTDPADSGLDYWTDLTKAWVVEDNGTLQLWTEFRAADPTTDRGSAQGPFSRQSDASFELTWGFTINGTIWRAVMTTQENPVPFAGTPLPTRVPGDSGTSTFLLQAGTQTVISDPNTGSTHRFTFVNPSGNPASQLAMRIPEEAQLFPRGTVLADLWVAAVVYAPQPYDMVAYKPCPGTVTQGTDKVTQCLHASPATTYFVQGGNRVQLTQLDWTLSPDNVTAQAGTKLHGTATATNQNTEHRTFQVAVRGPQNWTAKANDTSIHLAGQVSVTDAWSVQVPANASPGLYNVTFELDNGYGIKDAVLHVKVGAGNSGGPSQVTSSSPTAGSGGATSTAGIGGGGTGTAARTQTGGTTATGSSTKHTPASLPALLGTVLAVLLARRRQS